MAWSGEQAAGAGVDDPEIALESPAATPEDQSPGTDPVLGVNLGHQARHVPSGKAGQREQVGS